ncbi:hypothetical protein ACFL35_09540 [Candidatus Riflebacteria bacterium]
MKAIIYNQKRKASALIMAITVLAIIALMATIISFSTSQETDQMNKAVYRAICLQLAEGACNEVAGILLQDIANQSWCKGAYEMAVQSDIGKKFNAKLPANNPYVGGELKDQCQYTKKLCQDFAGFVGNFTLESVTVKLLEVQPILYKSGIMDERRYYSPIDRSPAPYSKPVPFMPARERRDWQGQYEIIAAVSYRGVGAKARIIRDLKIVNVGPIARQYSLFSMLGAAKQAEVEHDLNLGGQLIINNNKYKGTQARHPDTNAIANLEGRARMYLRGPYLVKVERPEKYCKSGSSTVPDSKVVYDGDQGFKGWSLLPEPRCLWSIRGNANGYIPVNPPEKSWWDDVKNFVKGVTYQGGKTYYRGSIPHKQQKFIPSFEKLLGRPRGPKSSKSAHKDCDENSYEIEHYWDPADKKEEEKHRILGVFNQASHNYTGGITLDPTKPKYIPLRFNNVKPATGFWSKAYNIFKNLGPLVIFGPIGKYLINQVGDLLGGWFTSNPQSLFTSPKAMNILPGNYKEFHKAAIRVVPDLSDLYAKDMPWTPAKDESKYNFPDGRTNGHAHLPLNGIYVVTKKCNFDRETTFTGNGLIACYRPAPNLMTISKSIHPPLIKPTYPQPVVPPPKGGVLTLVYHPMRGGGTTNPGKGSWGDKDNDYLDFKVGQGKAIILFNVSLFSMNGIKTKPGSQVHIEGNYVNFFMKKARQKGEVVINYPTSSLQLKPTPQKPYAPFREGNKKDYLKHTDYSVKLSPIISYYFAH